MTDLRHGDCLEVLAEIPRASIDAVITDPPYGLEFMGKDWDRFRVDDRTARWSEDRSGGAGRVDREDSGNGAFGRVAFSKRRTTSRCLTCGKRDAFRNPHSCGDAAEWTTEWVDGRPIELRAFQNWVEQWAAECLRILKPGGYLLAFGGTRTYHRLACGVEEAGFEIRDTIAWMYGSGFPKSHNVSKQIDKDAGIEPSRIVENEGGSLGGLGDAGWNATPRHLQYDEPVTDEAKRWNGWGTALKPAHEPIVVARKPLAGTVAANVLEHGTGALNIDAARVGVEGGTRAVGKGQASAGVYGDGLNSTPSEEIDAGRWPATVALDGEAADLLDEQAPNTGGGGFPGAKGGIGQGDIYGAPEGLRDTGRIDPNGGASRFFYVAKASRAERNAGLEGFAKALPDGRTDGQGFLVPGSHSTPRANIHPTVKPVALMRWLVRLVTPPGGTVVDPFLGSGTTGIAAALENARFVGIEQDAEYLEIARARIRFWSEHGDGALQIVARREAADRARDELAAAGQLDLFGEASS